MPSLLSALNTSVGRKLLTGITGIFLTLFLVAHLAGNLTLLAPDGGESFNLYTEYLHSFGPLLWIAEIILLFLFVLHAYIGISIYRRKKQARPVDYTYYKSKGGPSKQNAASSTMIYTGLIILIFLILHILHFKYRIFSPQDYMTVVNDESILDLFRHVNESFQNIWIVLGYTFVMVLIGFHLKHGIWSAFTSLGAKNPKLTPFLYICGTVVAILLAVGFLLLPIYLYLKPILF